jgi:vacuolar-type H+-ATPase subunit H
MKKVLKWSALSLGVVVLFLLLAPFLFKAKIMRAIETAANEQLNAVVSFQDVDLSLLRNFPNLRVTVEGFKVRNVAPFDSVELASIGTLETVIDVKSLFGAELMVRKVALVDARFDVRVTPEGIANYDIAKPDTLPAAPEAAKEEGSAFKLKLKEYSIQNGFISYNDQSMPMLLRLEGLNFSGSGDLAEEQLTMKTVTHADKGTFWFDGVTYINEARTDILADLGMDMKNMKFTIGGNEIKLNELLLGAEGWVAMPGENIDMDIRFKALKTDFRHLLSMVPLEFAKDVAGVNATGKMALDGYVAGTYNESSMPGIGLNVLVENGQFKYPDLPKSVDNIQMDLKVKADMNVMDNTTIDLDKFHFEMAQNPVDMRLKLRTPESDPDIDFACKAMLDLDNIREYIPVAEKDKVHGKINMDVALKGRMSAVEQEQYERFDAKGLIDIQNVFFKSDSLPYDMTVEAASFKVTPAFLDVPVFNARMGRSDVQAQGRIDNYLAYFLRDSLLTGAFNLQSKLMDVNEFMVESTSSSASQAAAPTPADTATSTLAPIPLPANVDFTLNASIDRLLYDTHSIEAVKGGVSLKDETARLTNLVMNLLEGTVAMNGTYDARDLSLPKMDFDFNISNMNIRKAADAFVTIDKLAPLAKSANGKFSTRLKLRANLDQTMMPINASVNGGGSLQTKNVVIKDFKPLVKIAEVTRLDRLREQSINDVNVSFAIVNGVVTVQPFTVKLDGIPAKIYGSTTLDQQIDYHVDMDIPFEKFPSGAVNQANSLIALANKKLGTNFSAGQKLPVKLRVTGTVTDPQIATNYGALGDGAASNLKDQLVNQAKDEAAKQLTNLKNEALEKAKAEKERLVAEARQQADRLVAEARQQADRAKAEAMQLAQKGKDEAYKKAQELENSAKNPLERAGKKLAADKLRKESDEAYNKAADRADREAERAVNEAKSKGDKLVADAGARGDQLIQNADKQGQGQIDNINK